MLYCSFSGKDRCASLLLSPILSILDRRPAALRAVRNVGCKTIGAVEGPDGCISSRFTPEQGACCSTGVIAVAHRIPAAANLVIYIGF